MGERDQPRTSAFVAGLKGRCPRCGQGSLFKGFVELAPACRVCGLDYGFADFGRRPRRLHFPDRRLYRARGGAVDGACLRAADVGSYGCVPAFNRRCLPWPAAALEGAARRPAVSNQGRRGAAQQLKLDAAQSQSRRGLLWPAVATLLGCAFLVALGVWQLHRLAWKEGLIAEIAARAKAPPQPLPPQAEWAQLRPDDYEYRHVELDGVFQNDKEAFVFRPAGGPERAPGYLVLTPLKLDLQALMSSSIAASFRSSCKDPAARGEIEGRTHSDGTDAPARIAQLLHARRRSRDRPVFHSRSRS